METARIDRCSGRPAACLQVRVLICIRESYRVDRPAGQGEIMTSSGETARFVRVLASKDVLALAFGAMIGWGWIVMTGNWIVSAGSLGAVSAFLIGGVAIVLVGLTYAELAAAMPQAGGEHVYSYRGLGHMASFVCVPGRSSSVI